FRESCQRIVATREQSRKALERLGFQVQPSAANFLFARPPAGNASEIYRQLKQRGILVRHFNQPGIDQWLRITVGRDEEMERLLQALAETVDKSA
ncbi:MAG TPA: aminotransferase class I/II-fold pyridoxal phosphate-dependent enzyme, partial [Methylothermaceae bacterium]|nr:aminotransferase class I/II-fold pyridoxal phosphate-dependent enzyme [Methylothermaceae bacterium]